MRDTSWFGLLLTASGCASVASPAEVERAHWHVQRLEKLRAEDGWLTLVGLDFLDEGEATLGRSEAATYRYANCADDVVGVLRVEGDVVHFRRVDAREQQRLVADDAGAPSVIRSGSVSFTLVRRNGRLALRVKDSASPVRTGFAGLELFPWDARLAVEARVLEPEQGTSVAITNVTGFVEEHAVAAELEFELEGERARFVATAGKDGGLFVVFADATNGRESHGGGRFLDVPKPEGGVALLDFNRATNPPCSFTAFATCPLPPERNRLAIPVRGGERAPLH